VSWSVGGAVWAGNRDRVTTPHVNTKRRANIRITGPDRISAIVSSLYAQAKPTV
jgi:hypothetical protein